MMDDFGDTILPLSKYAARSASAVQVRNEFQIVNLRSAADLANSVQITWLVQADTRGYAQTRHWACWIRALSPTAAGLVWRSKRQPTEDAYVFFGDRLSAYAIQERTMRRAGWQRG
jgi:hypothetical protein